MMNLPEAMKAEKHAIFVKLRDQGNNIHNTNVMEKGVGEIRTVRTSQSANLPVKCSLCIRWYEPSLFKFHRCTAALEAGRKPSLKESKKKMAEILNSERPGTERVLDELRNDDVGLLCKNDSTLLEFLRFRVSKLRFYFSFPDSCKYQCFASGSHVKIVENRGKRCKVYCTVSSVADPE